MKNKIILSILFLSLLTACTNNGQSSSEVKEDTSISSIKKTDSGKTYYSLDQKPVTPIGVQIRTDLLLYAEHQDFSVIEDRFQKAKELGVSLVEIPIPWDACEPSEDAYSFRDLGKMMNLADSLGLKIEILLFSTNTTGWSDHVPSYIKEDSETYPRYVSQISPNSYFMVQNDPDLLGREGKWLNAMMDAISSWSASHENRHVVSAIQIHNESDTFPRFVLSQQQIYTVDGSRRLTDIEAWKETKEAYDYLGKIVKNSSYPCITRVNVAQAYKDAWTSFVPDIFNLEGIDIVGDDTYEQTVAFNKNMILDFNNEEDFRGNNFPHVSENDGSYNSVASLILASTALGGGYFIYDLATPEIALDSYGWDDWSILNPRTLEDKPHTELARKIIKGISLAGSDYVLADKENIAAFNVRENIPQENKQQNIQTTHALINFETNCGAIGYVISHMDHLDVFMTDEATLSFNNVTLASTYSIGSIDNQGQFRETASFDLSSSSLVVEGGKLYRIGIEKVDEVLKSNTVRNIG